MSDKVFGTTEWAKYNYNFIIGCKNDCKYCYSKEMSIRFKRKTSDNWKFEDVNTVKVFSNFRSYDGRVMVPSSHDLSIENIDYSVNVITKLLQKDNDLLIVSKPRLSVIKAICNEVTPYRDRILFRFSIGSTNTDVLKFWEPGASSFKERLECLKYAFSEGFFTSVSCEPVLDNNVEELVRTVQQYVSDSIWIGKPNFLLRRLKTNGFDKHSIEISKAKELLHLLDDTYFLNLEKALAECDKIRWKESVKKILGKEIPTQKGLDI